MCHVDEWRACGLRKNGRRLAHTAEIDCSGIDGFKQRRTSRELGPSNLEAQRGEAPFEIALALEQDEIAVFLIPDVDDLIRRVRGE
jgi:hypothetical protein